MDFFFYGTLRDAEVRRRVLGCALPATSLEDAELVGFRAVFVAGASYPTVIHCPGARTPGLLAHGLCHADAARLSIFEGMPYQAVDLVVAGRRSGPVAARVYVVRGGVRATARRWTLTVWQRRFRAAFLAAMPVCPRPRGQPLEAPSKNPISKATPLSVAPRGTRLRTWRLALPRVGKRAAV